MDFCEPMLEEAVKKRTGSPAGPPLSSARATGWPCPARPVLRCRHDFFGLREHGRPPSAWAKCAACSGPAAGCSCWILQPFFWFRPFYYAYLKFVPATIAAVMTGDRSAYEYLWRFDRVVS